MNNSSKTVLLIFVLFSLLILSSCQNEDQPTQQTNAELTGNEYSAASTAGSEAGTVSQTESTTEPTASTETSVTEKTPQPSDPAVPTETAETEKTPDPTVPTETTVTETPQLSDPTVPTEWPIPIDADPEDLRALDPDKAHLPSSADFSDFQVGTLLTEVYQRVGLPQRTSNSKFITEGQSTPMNCTLFEYDTDDGKTFYIYYSCAEKDIGKLEGCKISFISDEKPLVIRL